VPSSTSNTAAPVDPPIPVPDVDGADATPGGLPRRQDLSLRQKLIVDSSAIADVGLRTAIASIVGAAMLPKVAAAALHPADSRAERKALRFYAEQGAAKDPELSFPAPTELPRVSSRPANPVAEWMAHGNVHNIQIHKPSLPSRPPGRPPSLSGTCWASMRAAVVGTIPYDESDSASWTWSCSGLAA
jgi:hypothetical protein